MASGSCRRSQPSLTQKARLYPAFPASSQGLRQAPKAPPQALDFLAKIDESANSMSNILHEVDLTNQDGLMILVGTAFIYLLYFTLSKKLFSPLLEHLEHREGVTTGALHAAAQMRQKGQALRARYDEGLFQARVEANRQKNDILTAARKAASETIAAAEASAAAELQSGRAAIEKQISDSQSRIDSEARELADKLAAKVDAQLTVH